MWESNAQMEFLHNTFGETDPIRLENQVNYLNSIGFKNLEFKFYPGVPHKLTLEMLEDFINFLVENRDIG